MGLNRNAGRLLTGLVALGLAACSVDPPPSSDLASPTDSPAAPSRAASPASAPPSDPTPATIGSSEPWVKRDIPGYTTVGGADITMTTDADLRYVHAVVSNLEEGWKNGGDASLYLRTGDEGQAWDQRLVLGGTFPKLASSGGTVFIALEAYACRGGVGVLRNDDHGRNGGWSRMTCLTPVGPMNSEAAPAIAAAGSLVFVAASNDEDGRVVLHRSRDRGRTWTSVRLGKAHDEEGYPGGDLVVAATDDLVVVAWEDRGSTKVRVSVDAGDHWGPVKTIATGRPVLAAGRDSRVAINGADSHGNVWVRVRTGADDWQEIVGPDPDPGPSLVSRFGGVVLGPGGWIAGCVVDAVVDGEVADVHWVISSDGGRTWGAAAPFLPACPEDERIIWTGDDHVFAVGGVPDDSDYTYGLVVSQADR